MILKKIASVVFLFLALVIICNGAPSRARFPVSPKALFQGPQIYLSVSPIASYRYNIFLFRGATNVELFDRMLEMHWLNVQNQVGDTIGLYSVNPMGMDGSEAEQYLLEKHPVSSSSGKVKTEVRYARRPLDASSPRCLGFWVAYSQNNVIVQSNCLMIHPTWMNDIKNEIKNIPLTSLMIPGTHNAGSWLYYEGLESENPYVKYTFCHEDSIYEQLIHGIRSLDVRTGYYGASDEKFYINHDIARIRPLRTLLEDVKKFVIETNEIVLLDFHRFPVGFNSQEIHDQLVTFIEGHLGDLLAPKSLSLSVTPERLWELKRTVVVFYADGNAVSTHDNLWPAINQAWADTNKLEELESYQATALVETGCKGIAWSAMAQLTSTVGDAIIRPGFGVRGYSNLSNDEVSNWYQRESWYSRAMIVALDFYRSTNVIETAIEVNKNHANVCL